jgi:transcriptional regulator with XRE-family HTH domain
MRRTSPLDGGSCPAISPEVTGTLAGGAAAAARRYHLCMRGGDVIRRARTRGDLSAAELAGQLGVSEAEVRAWEGGDPAFSLVQRIVEVCHANFASVVTEPDVDPEDVTLLEETLRLTPEERLHRMLAYVRFIEAGRAAVMEAQ